MVTGPFDRQEVLTALADAPRDARSRERTNDAILDVLRLRPEPWRGPVEALRVAPSAEVRDAALEGSLDL